MRIAEATPLPLDAAATPAEVASPAVAPDLVRLVLRRSVPVVAGMLGLVVVLSGLALQRDATAEIDAALATARMSRYLSNLPQLNDTQALAVLRDHAELRHLALRVTDGHYRTLLGGPAELTATERAVSWTVPRPEGPPWTVTLAATGDTQRRSALRLLAEVLAAVAAGSAALLAMVGFTLRRALAPLPQLTAALQSLQAQPGAPGAERARHLPSFGTADLERVAQAVRSLGAQLAGRDAEQRLHARRAQHAVEAERQRLAGEMHDEFAQRLTALRLDTTWMRRRLQGDASFDTVIASMLGQLGRLQHDLRGWVGHLHPLLPQRAPGETGAPHHGPRPATPQHLRDLLVQQAEASGPALRVQLDFRADTAQLPQSVLLSVLRMTREALDNAARHGRARQAAVMVHIDGRSGRLHWAVSDDGVGLDTDLATACSRGHGLSALQQRAWSHHGTLTAAPGPGGHGLWLGACLSLDAP